MSITFPNTKEIDIWDKTIADIANILNETTKEDIEVNTVTKDQYIEEVYKQDQEKLQEVPKDNDDNNVEFIEKFCDITTVKSLLKDFDETSRIKKVNGFVVPTKSWTSNKTDKQQQISEKKEESQPLIQQQTSQHKSLELNIQNQIENTGSSQGNKGSSQGNTGSSQGNTGNNQRNKQNSQIKKPVPSQHNIPIKKKRANKLDPIKALTEVARVLKQKELSRQQPEKQQLQQGKHTLPIAKPNNRIRSGTVGLTHEKSALKPHLKNRHRIRQGIHRNSETKLVPKVPMGNSSTCDPNPESICNSMLVSMPLLKEDLKADLKADLKTDLKVDLKVDLKDDKTNLKSLSVEKSNKTLKNQQKDSLVKLSNQEILKWNLELRNFLLYSNKHWKLRYPQFRANYQGDKTVGYSLAKGIVDVPKQYKKLHSIKNLTDKLLKSLPSKSFVIKETLGHSGSRVLCMNYDADRNVYNDFLRHSEDIKPENLLAYIHKKMHFLPKVEKSVRDKNLDSESPLIIEELLPFILTPISLEQQNLQTQKPENQSDGLSGQSSGQETVSISLPDTNLRLEEQTKLNQSKFIKRIPAPPPDYKVYVVLGKPRLVNVYFRLEEGRFEASFKLTSTKENKNVFSWTRIPIKDLYQDLVSLDYQDLPTNINFCWELPSEKTRKKLLQLAIALAKAHDAKFVRYDFYVIKDRIVLGEITPLCGGIRNNILKEKMLRILFPPDIRQTYNYIRNQN